MKKIAIFVLVILLLQIFAVSALTSSEAKEKWKDAKQASKDAQAEHQTAKIAYTSDPSEENEQEVIDTGKVLLDAALDEAEAWLVWRDVDAEENTEIPDELRETIQTDIDTNLDKIDELREDVDGITTRFELGVVFLKMIGKYFELLTDVARNTGYVWVHIGNSRADSVEDYEQLLRSAAEDMDDNEDIIEKLDMAKEEIEEARENIANAEGEYDDVVLPGTPMVNFGNGNSYLRIARGNLLGAHGYLNQAYRLMISGGE